VAGVGSRDCSGPCMAGYACPAPALANNVTACPPGQFAAEGVGYCSACAAGTFAAAVSGGERVLHALPRPHPPSWVGRRGGGAGTGPLHMVACASTWTGDPHSCAGCSGCPAGRYGALPGNNQPLCDGAWGTRRECGCSLSVLADPLVFATPTPRCAPNTLPTHPTPPCSPTPRCGRALRGGVFLPCRLDLAHPDSVLPWVLLPGWQRVMHKLSSWYGRGAMASRLQFFTLCALGLWCCVSDSLLAPPHPLHPHAHHPFPLPLLCPGRYGLNVNETNPNCTGLCKPGRYSQYGAPTADCYLCWAGYTCPSPGAVSYDIGPCPNGTYSLPGDANCTLCPGGRYGSQVALGYVTCNGPCSAGYMCPNGSTSSTAQPCSAGQWSAGGAAVCELCNPGRYGDAVSLKNTSDCTGPCRAGYACPAGSTVPAPPATACGIGSYSLEGSSGEGKVVSACPSFSAATHPRPAVVCVSLSILSQCARPVPLGSLATCRPWTALTAPGPVPLAGTGPPLA
jgi:hypothetical protein